MIEKLPEDDCTIEFREVRKSFSVDGTPGTQVLKNFSGKVQCGSIVTLVGPSGSGKSTLLSLCNLLTTPDDGEVYVYGKEVRQWNIPDLRRKVGLVFQTPTMFSGTVLDNIELGARLQGKKLANPEKFLIDVGLSADLLAQPADKLSGGQKQRVALARVLANEPSILLLDEVTSALDPSSTRHVEEVILKIHKEQKLTILWVTHNLEQARLVGQQTWLLVNGCLVEAKATADFFDAPQQAVTRQFLQGELGGGIQV